MRSTALPGARHPPQAGLPTADRRPAGQGDERAVAPADAGCSAPYRYCARWPGHRALTTQARCQRPRTPTWERGGRSPGPADHDVPPAPGARQVSRSASSALAMRTLGLGTRSLGLRGAPGRPEADRTYSSSAPVQPRAGPAVPGCAHRAVFHVPDDTDHGRLKARLRPMRGLKRHWSARTLAAGHAFARNLRLGHTDSPPTSPPATGSAQHSTSSRWASDSRHSRQRALVCALIVPDRVLRIMILNWMRSHSPPRSAPAQDCRPR
jgi:hypothetical protein